MEGRGGFICAMLLKVWLCWEFCLYAKWLVSAHVCLEFMRCVVVYAHERVLSNEGVGVVWSMHHRSQFIHGWYRVQSSNTVILISQETSQTHAMCKPIMSASFMISMFLCRNVEILFKLRIVLSMEELGLGNNSSRHIYCCMVMSMADISWPVCL